MKRIKTVILIMAILVSMSGCISAGLDIGMAAADLVATMASQPNKTQCEGEGCDNSK